MLTLTLMRHGEAAAVAESDFARPLTDFGRLQAETAAKALTGWGVWPGLIVSSCARRASETAQVVAAGIGGELPVVREPFLYGGYTTWQLLDCVARHAASHGVDSVLVVGHNPDITHKASSLCRDILGAAFPTGGVLVLLFYCGSWAEVAAHSASVLRSTFG